MVTAVPRPSPRMLATYAAGALAVASAGGLTSYALFSQGSTLKWALTVAGSVLLLMAATVRQPLRPIVVLAIIAAPFSNFEASFAGLNVSILWPLLALGWLVAVLGYERSAARSRQAVAAVWFVVLLGVPIVEGGAFGTQLTLLATMLVTAWLAAQLARQRGGAGVVLGALGACAAFQGAIAIWQFHTGHQLNLYGGAQESVFGQDYFFNFDGLNRPTGGLDDPISLGNVLALGLPAMLYTAITVRNVLVRVATIVGSGVIVYALAISLSRMSWFGAIAGVAIVIVLLPRGRRATAALGVALVTTVTISIAMAAGGQTLIDRFDTALAPTASTSATAEGDRMRLRLWDAGERLAVSHPIAGVGFGDLHTELGRYGLDFGPLSHVHSTYLMLAACAGGLGIAALLFMLGALVGDLGAARRANPLAASALAGCLGVTIVVWLTDWTIGYPPVAAVFAAMFGAAAGLARRVPPYAKP